MATSQGAGIGSSSGSGGSENGRQIPLPVIAAAALGLVILGFFGGRRKGRKTGGAGGRRSGSGDAGAASETGLGRHGSAGRTPTSLAELRALRASAAEGRSKNGGVDGRGVGATKLTPLGSAIRVCRKVDGLEDEATKLIASVSDKGALDAQTKKNQAMLIELLTQAQLELDGIKGDESVRPLRKAQTQRMNTIIQGLEKLSHVVQDSAAAKKTTTAPSSTPSSIAAGVRRSAGTSDDSPPQ